MSSKQYGIAFRYRFDRKGNVVPERRRFESYFGTDDYRSGMPIFAVKRSSPAREAFKAASRIRRVNRAA